MSCARSCTSTASERPLGRLRRTASLRRLAPTTWPPSSSASCSDGARRCRRAQGLIEGDVHGRIGRRFGRWFCRRFGRCFCRYLGRPLRQGPDARCFRPEVADRAEVDVRCVDQDFDRLVGLCCCRRRCWSWRGFRLGHRTGHDRGRRISHRLQRRRCGRSSHRPLHGSEGQHHIAHRRHVSHGDAPRPAIAVVPRHDVAGESVQAQ